MESSYPCTRLSDPAHPSIHAYYDVCPEDPRGERVACFRFDGPVPGAGRVEIRARDGALLDAFGAGTTGNGHVGGFPTWIDADRLCWLSGIEGSNDRIRSTIRDLASHEEIGLPGRIRQFHGPSGRGLVQEAQHPDNPQGLTRSLAVVDASGAVLGRLTLEDCRAAHPDPESVPPLETLNLKNSKWSPDGSCFLLVCTTEDYRKRSDDRAIGRLKCLMLADADGGNVRFLGDFGHHPSWTPDGRGVIAFVLTTSGQDLVRWDIENGRSEVLLADVPGIHPSLAPDGRSVVTDRFNHPEPGQAQILRYDLEHDGAVEVLASFPHRDFGHRDGHHPHPVFSRDGRRLYFNAQDGGPCGLYALDLEQA